MDVLELPRLSTSSLEAERYEQAAAEAADYFAREAARRYVAAHAHLLRDELRREVEDLVSTWHEDTDSIYGLSVHLWSWSQAHHGILARAHEVIESCSENDGDSEVRLVFAAGHMVSAADWVGVAMTFVREDLHSTIYGTRTSGWLRWRLHTHVQAAWDVCNTGPLPTEVASLPPGPEPVEPPAPF